MSRNIVITGAASGIGLALSRLYLEAGENVIAWCRKASDDLTALSDKYPLTIVEGVDVTDADQLSKAAKKIGDTPIDLLINNAGLFLNEQLGKIDYETVLTQFNVNAVGALRATEAVLPYFNQPAKIILITSRMGSIADNTSGAYYGYRMSKAAMNAAGKSLSQDLQPKKIAVGIVHPGFVQTRMVDFAGDVSALDSAKGIVAREAGLSISNTGSFWHANGDSLPW